MIKATVEVNVNVKQMTQDYIDAINKAMTEIMMDAYHFWQDLAGKKLHTTKRIYREAVQHKEVEPGNVEVFLQHTDEKDNWLATALETGHPQILLWRKTLAGRAAFHHSSLSKNPHSFKGAAPKTPYVDIPFRLRAKEQGKPDFYRRMSRKNIQGKWIHPGFKPIGKGGPGPMIPEVIKHIQEEAPKTISKLMARVKV